MRLCTSWDNTRWIEFSVPVWKCWHMTKRFCVFTACFQGVECNTVLLFSFLAITSMSIQWKTLALVEKVQCNSDKMQTRHLEPFHEYSRRDKDVQVSCLSHRQVGWIWLTSLIQFVHLYIDHSPNRLSENCMPHPKDTVWVKESDFRWF